MCLGFHLFVFVFSKSGNMMFFFVFVLILFSSHLIKEFCVPCELKEKIDGFRGPGIVIL